MSEVSADNLTDKQIRETEASLIGLRPTVDVAGLLRSCAIALHGATKADLRRGETRKLARQRIADAINARAKAGNP